MIIQQQARVRQNRQENEIQITNDETNLRKKEKNLKVLVRKSKGKRRKTTAVVSVPRSLEEAPLRRMDRRALNALRKRRADRHMIAFLALVAVLFTVLGVGSVVIWTEFRSQYKFVGLFIIVGPILLVTGLSIFICSLELVLRLRKQIQRVMDPSLLKTNNYHEVKHWIEPELVSFGWGQFNFDEESKTMDDKKLRKRQQRLNETV